MPYIKSFNFSKKKDSADQKGEYEIGGNLNR